MAPKKTKKAAAPKAKRKPAPKIEAKLPVREMKNTVPGWLEMLPTLLVVLALALAVAAGAVYLLVLRPALVQRAAEQQMPPIGAAFSLINDKGQPVTEHTLANGHDYHLIFFGYTNCPDECPTMMNTIAQAMQKLPAATQDRVKTVLVSVDPKRDTPARLREYLDGFDKRFIGWTGPKSEIDRMTKGYMAFYSIMEEPMNMKDMDHEHEHGHDVEADGEEISHSSVLYLMGPDGKYVTHMSQEDGADGIAAKIAEQVK
jgi:protein SCO1/2